MGDNNLTQLAMSAISANEKAIGLIETLEKEIVSYKADFESNLALANNIYRKEKERLAVIDLSQVQTGELLKELERRKE